MIKQIENLPENVLGFTYTDEVTGKDYETVVFPAVERAAREHNKLRFLCVFSESFHSLNFKAMIDDTVIGFRHFKAWEKIAFVSDHNAINHIIKALTFLLPGEIKIFMLAEYNTAVDWISKNN